MEETGQSPSLSVGGRGNRSRSSDGTADSSLASSSHRTAPSTRRAASTRRRPLEALGGFFRRKTTATGLAGRSPAVRVAPALQAEFYAALELVVATTTSRFLVDNTERLNADAVQREAKAWESGVWVLFNGTKAKRAPVSAFLYPLDVQARLLDAHRDVLVRVGTFGSSGSGGNGSSQHWNARAVADTLAGWGRVVAALGCSGLAHGSRSLCMPDWLVTEHLRAAEKLLGLFVPERHFDDTASARWLAVTMRIREALMLDAGVRSPSDGGEPGEAAPPAAPAPEPPRRYPRESYMEGW